MHFSELSSGKTNQTELVALLITQGKDFVEGIENVYDRVKGSCSMLLLTEDGIIVARDKWGRTPIIIGKKDGAYAATSESSSLPNLDYEIDRFVGPGEILRLRADGIEQMRRPNEQMQVCSFLWVYYGFPVSCYEGRNVEEVRFQSGYKMGKKDESEVDCVCGIPDSGVGMALGYAEGKGAPYHRAIAKYTPTWPRSFTPANQELRSLVAKMKLIPNRAMLEGKRILFCDDSIVRGTQLRDNVKILYDYGAKEVHMRIACPPLIYGCPFLGFTSSKSPLELITRRIIKELEGDENKNLEKYVPPDMPNLKSGVARDEFTDELIKQVWPVIDMVQGRAFVLCTSYRGMERAAEQLREYIAANGRDYTVLVQREESKEKLLDKFRHEQHPILVATMSFWEGIDIKGDQLSLVIIDKLPFPNREDPVFDARCKWLDSQGQSSFNILSVPAAAIALKQGTGRLIRSEADRGILIIGDVRLVRSGYGKKIWQSLPPYTKTLRLERLMQFWNEPDSWQ